MPTFYPPVAADNPPILPETQGLARRLFRYYGPYSRGRSVLRVSGVYMTVDYPTDSQIALATEVYLGGHVYEVDQATADRLTAAGYNVV